MQKAFDYKEELRRHKLGVLDPMVAQYVRENPMVNIESIARRFFVTDSTVQAICRRQGVKRGQGRRKKQ